MATAMMKSIIWIVSLMVEIVVDLALMLKIAQCANASVTLQQPMVSPMLQLEIMESPMPC